MDFEALFHSRLEELRETQQYRSLTHSMGISFVNNDYLGLSKHPQMIEASRNALEVYGTGSKGSRLLGGHNGILEETEAALAAFFRAPSALIFSSGYLANQAILGILSPLVDKVYSDELNHASLIDGLRLTKAPKEIYPHATVPPPCEGTPLVVTESLFSMDGDFAPLSSLIAFTKQYGGFLLVDEAHSAGVFLEGGRGLLSGETVDWARTAMVVTFGKAFGCSGAAILGSAALRDMLINQARSFIFTTAPSPASIGCVSAALKIFEEERWRQEELWSRAASVRDILKEIPYVKNDSGVPPARSVWEERSPIIPLFVRSAARAMRFAESMREIGVELRAIRYPTVRSGTERIRISLSLNVSSDNTLEMAKQMVRLWKEFS